MLQVCQELTRRPNPSPTTSVPSTEETWILRPNLSPGRLDQRELANVVARGEIESQFVKRARRADLSMYIKDITIRNIEHASQYAKPTPT